MKKQKTELDVDFIGTQQSALTKKKRWQLVSLYDPEK